MHARLATLLALCACGSTAPEPVRAAPPDVATATSSAHVLRRSQVHAAVQAGFGAFLQTIAVDEHPVFVRGKFHGFRIAAYAPQYAGIDIVPGDVITSVNGMPIERPEQALEAFRALDAAKELDVAYEHDGEPREMRYPIVDDAR